MGDFPGCREDRLQEDSKEQPPQIRTRLMCHNFTWLQN